MEKRHHPRIPLRNLFVDASDGFEFCQGRISDISKSGVCMTDLPKSFSGDANELTAIITGRGKYFRMIVSPKWSTSDDIVQSVGAEIIDPPLSWKEFIVRL
ncbi:MAG: hypothetical protein ACD_75C00309G0002 [uncultured bacterium]|nr:MAG: hypothetical protein ACD_75C00309G0002 [uncultured bacterium]